MLTRMASYVSALVRRDDGATMVEYGLMVALVAIIAMVGATALGVSVTGVFSNIATCISGGAC